ncbi:MAG TPA: beta-propeller fold lactonase family protein [Terracidiphilus sp.]|nr:beta-propeller fold lactonase family protein [Terracidiphilus sp.]
MKFTKFGKALLISALSAGVILGVSSCVRSYTVGFIYVTGTVTAQSTGNGIISGYKIDHNTGFLTPINGLPISSGGANPGRAVLVTGSRFLYVLNQGVNAQGGSTCTTANPCLNSNITEFALGGNGILSPQETFFTQGINPFRMIADTTGNYLAVLDHDSPSNATCKLALGASANTCGDITIFQINQTTGRLTLVVNAQVTSAGGTPLTYFPVPSNPIDFVMSAGYILTLSGTPSTGDSVFPYVYSGSSGQLTLGQNSPQPLNIKQATAIINASSVIYVLDNEPVTLTSSATFPNNTYPSQVLPFTVGNNGALQAETGGIVPDDPTLSNPIYLMVESKGKYVYMANQGNNLLGPNANSGIAGYFITTSPSYTLSFTTPSAFGSGSGPQCIVEDPSDQFIYTANFVDSTITAQSIDVNSGILRPLRVASSYKLQGPANWCLVDGRTD